MRQLTKRLLWHSFNQSTSCSPTHTMAAMSEVGAWRKLQLVTVEQ
jgi:hypothetical protein